MKLIPDKEIIKIPIKDNKEKLVHVRKYVPNIVIRPGLYIKKEGNSTCKKACLIRESVGKRLKVAQDLLPKEYRLMLRCGYRPISLQKKHYIEERNRLKKKNPSWSKEKLNTEMDMRIAPLYIVPPHPTGSAVDITIIDNKYHQLDMGTKLGEFNKEKTFTYSKNISNLAKENRKLLINVMEKAGFVNYPTEWWHWSYGDRYWAAVKKEKISIYDKI